MTKTRWAFTDEFKQEAVALLASSGRPLMQVASELGIQPSMLRSWRGAAKGTMPFTTTVTTPPRSRASSASSIACARQERDV